MGDPVCAAVPFTERASNDNLPFLKGDDRMELHAFERMAQTADSVLLPVSEPADCGLLPQPMTAFPEHTPAGMAYVPYQMWGAVYEADQGMAQGTMFPELDLPFCAAERGNWK